MALREILLPWDRQPDADALVVPGPLGGLFTNLWLFNSGVFGTDIAGGNHASLVANPARYAVGTSQYGIGPIGNGGADAGVSTGVYCPDDLPSYSGTSTPICVFVIATPTVFSGTNEYCLTRATESAGGYGYSIGLSNPSSKTLRMLLHTAGGTTGWTTGNDYVDSSQELGQPHFYGFTWPSPSTIYMVSGPLGTDAVYMRKSAAADVTLGYASVTPYFGGMEYSGQVASPVIIHAAGATYGPSLDSDFLIEIGRNPSLLFSEQRIWVPASAAGGPTYTLTAAAGSYTLTGNAAALKVSRNLVAAAGSYTLTGNDATLTYTPSGATYTLTAASGSFTLTGQDAALKAARNLTAAAGTYTLTGNAAALAHGYVLTAAAGTYTLTGQDVAFGRTYALAANAGDFTLTGNAATLTYSAAPAATAETYAGGYRKKKSRYDRLAPPTREKLAELARAQRVAMGILPPPVRKRVESAVKKAARKEADVATLAPTVAEVAQQTDTSAADLIRAIEAAYEYQRALAQSRFEADLAERQESARRAAELERQQVEARAQAWEAHLVSLRADDDAYLQAHEATRQQAVDLIRQVQKALLTLVSQ